MTSTSIQDLIHETYDITFSFFKLFIFTNSQNGIIQIVFCSNSSQKTTHVVFYLIGYTLSRLIYSKKDTKTLFNIKAIFIIFNLNLELHIIKRCLIRLTV